VLNNRRNKTAVLIGVAALVFALPALGQQDSPESLLPPGFGDPVPPAPPASPKSPTGGNDRPGAERPKTSSSNTAPAAKSEAAKDEEAKSDEEEVLEVHYDVPPAASRSLSEIGFISDASGGYAKDAYGQASGVFLSHVLTSTKGPIASRWASILSRRMLSSRTLTPRNVSGADWVAERAWLILKMGDAVAARHLVQQVDAGRYTSRLYDVAMQSFLANADLGGFCPLADSGSSVSSDPTWKMARPICASLAGEQGSATALLNQARSKRWMVGIDYLLTEKAVGAGTNGRRSVKIEWDKVTMLNTWRHGLANATGIEPPASLYDKMGNQVKGWISQLPMVSDSSRMKASNEAATLGIMSNRSLVDLYSEALDDPDSKDDDKAKAELLASAYEAKDDAAKVSAMTSLWDGAPDARARQAMLVLTARAAALIEPSASHNASADNLIASMMTAGLDQPAVRWAKVISAGSLGWGILVAGAPGMDDSISASQLDDFYDNDQSVDTHKSALLLAGLAGLGRVDSDALKEFSNQLDVDVTRSTRWSEAISNAAQRGEKGTVMLLSVAGLQGADWTKIPAHQLFYIVRALQQVGLDAESRMIAAEAVSFG
jgi:hypothetical protein